MWRWGLYAFLFYDFYLKLEMHWNCCVFVFPSFSCGSAILMHWSEVALKCVVALVFCFIFVACYIYFTFNEIRIILKITIFWFQEVNSHIHIRCGDYQLAISSIHLVSRRHNNHQDFHGSDRNFNNIHLSSSSAYDPCYDHLLLCLHCLYRWAEEIL